MDHKEQCDYGSESEERSWKAKDSFHVVSSYLDPIDQPYTVFSTIIARLQTNCDRFHKLSPCLKRKIVFLSMALINENI